MRQLIDLNSTNSSGFTSTAGKLMMLSGLLALGLMIAGTQPVAAGDTHRHGAHAGAHDAKTPQRGCPTPAPIQATANKPNAGQTIAVAPQGSGGQASGGLMAHVDPATGELVEAPVDGTQLIAPQAQLGASAGQEPLVVIPSEVPGGGVRIDTRNRNIQFLTVTNGPDGKPVFGHGPCDPGTKAKR